MIGGSHRLGPPEPQRARRVVEPQNAIVSPVLARPVEDVARITSENACRFYGVGGA